MGVDMKQGVLEFDVSDSYAVPWPWYCRICHGLRQAKGMKDSSKRRRRQAPAGNSRNRRLLPMGLDTVTFKKRENNHQGKVP
jgi:hypothetical protein